MRFTVLVPLDGSPLAERALPFATRLVAGQRGRLVVAHVRPPRLADHLSTYDVATLAATVQDEGVDVTSRFFCARPDEVAEVLNATLRTEAADLVVMSTHGRGGLTRTIFGSVADQLVRRAEVPILLIPPACQTSWQGQRSARILVPLDGSPLAETALDAAGPLADRLNAEMLLVRALSPSLHARYRNDKLVLSCADFVEIEDAWFYLSSVADGLRAKGHRPSIRVLVGPPAAAIADAASDDSVDLIAMTTHGRGGLGRFLLGSVADGLLRRSSVPVLLVRCDVGAQRASATAKLLESV